MFKGVKEGLRAHGGLMILAIDFGLIPFLLFVWFSLSICLKLHSKIAIMFWILSIMIFPINSQLLWFTLILFWSVNWLQEQAESCNENLLEENDETEE